VGVILNSQRASAVVAYFAALVEGGWIPGEGASADVVAGRIQYSTHVPWEERRMRRAIIPVLLLAGAAVAWAALRVPPSTGRDPAPDRRWTAVQEAVERTVPGGTASGMRAPDHIQGEWSQNTHSVAIVQILRRRFDWARVPMDDARGGPVEILLEQGNVHAGALRGAGFQTMLSETFGVGGEPPWPLPDQGHRGSSVVPVPPPLPDLPGTTTRHRPQVSVESIHRSDSGGGGGIGQVSLDRPSIVQERIYVVPRSGATLFVRCDYVQKDHAVEVEFRYVDRTLLGVPYPTGSHLVGREPGGYSSQERIVPVGKGR